MENHNIYILSAKDKEGSDVYKVGYSGDIKIRLNAYFYHNPSAEVLSTY